MCICMVTRGSGKSTAAQLSAEALGRHFGYISLTVQTMDSRLLGFMSPVGKYIETEFFRCYTKGGVFCIDEMDNASGNLLTALNSCLENNQAAFPCGVMKRHKDFVVVATGNTSGGGANPMFPERRPFDKAFQERFTYIRWDYDTRMERAVALTFNAKQAHAWTDYIQQLREYCKKNHPRVLVSPRATFKGCDYLKDKKLTTAQILEALVFKGLEEGTRQAILTANPIPEEFRDKVAVMEKGA